MSAGVADRPTAAARPPVRRVVPGLLVAVAVAAVATALGAVVPLVGGPVFGIALGAAAGSLVPRLRGPVWTDGFGFAGRVVLPLSIVVLGTGLPLGEVARVGVGSLPVMLGTLAVALGGGLMLGRLLGVGGDTRTLIAVGTGICGASAIAAAGSVLRPRQADTAYAVGTIVTFNVAAVLLFPPLGHLLHLDAQAFGLWAGTAVNDTSSVVAAGYAYGAEAGRHAVVVKLARSLMIIPVVLGLAALVARRGGAHGPVPWHRVVPPFLVGFLAAATLRSAGLVPDPWLPALGATGAFLVTTALAGTGLALRPADLRAAGVRPLLLGGLLWVAVAASSLGLQALTGAL
ncbi:YeiH family protein [Actinokineospora bangkokensis]|uniref:Sulfate exporter family transporter n=1 Tax=Actinokineospora bangkokensis TaxID=1193682 RepID=A0A1Q9LN41_9PSEU|nr:putative sulfate exporter family transporter [Actinokineospora bangkokensis]OLR93466.1 hypothetical protein BJP25_14250 [Actinokineospora bangkokensis]